MRAHIIATTAKHALIIYSQAGKSLMLQIWDSTPLLQARDAWKEWAIKFSVVIQNTKNKILEVADFRGLYQTLVNVFSKKCNSTVFYWIRIIRVFVGTKRDLYFGCSGLIIGIAIGLVIGIYIKRNEQVVRYMQAVQCLNYLGIEVKSL